MVFDINILESTERAQYDVIVVGLGAAGATAAGALARAGTHVLALEAQDRVGGRVETIPFGDGIVELGAEWIHGTVGSVTFDTAKKHNISLVSQPMEFEVRTSSAGVASELVAELTGFCLAIMEEDTDPQPVGHFVTKKVKEYLAKHHPEVLRDENFIKNFLELMNLITNNYEATNDWNDASTAGKYEELEGDQHVSFHRYGYKTFFDILLNTHNNGPGLPHLTIKLNSEVTNIQWSRDPKDLLRVTVNDGTQYSAKSVIVTMSLGVLKENYCTLFTPSLPHEKVFAIQKMSIGVMDKIVLEFPTVWWPKPGYMVLFLWEEADRKAVVDWSTKVFMGSNPMGSRNVFTLWTSGEIGKMVETLPEEEVKSKCMALIRRFLGSDYNIPEPTSMIRSTWYNNPFFRGSYTYDGMNVLQIPTAREDLAKPILDSAGTPRLMFAGEATNSKHFSTVHGASASGYREASRLLPSSKL